MVSCDLSLCLVDEVDHDNSAILANGACLPGGAGLGKWRARGVPPATTPPLTPANDKADKAKAAANVPLHELPSAFVKASRPRLKSRRYLRKGLSRSLPATRQFITGCWSIPTAECRHGASWVHNA